eukprot:Skav231268  [mRNA]  locus=scaffold2436:374781:375107:+ [translate_table: standard]
MRKSAADSGTMAALVAQAVYHGIRYANKEEISLRLARHGREEMTTYAQNSDRADEYHCIGPDFDTCVKVHGSLLLAARDAFLAAMIVVVGPRNRAGDRIEPGAFATLY